MVMSYNQSSAESISTHLLESAETLGWREAYPVMPLSETITLHFKDFFEKEEVNETATRKQGLQVHQEWQRIKSNCSSPFQLSSKP